MATMYHTKLVRKIQQTPKGHCSNNSEKNNWKKLKATYMLKIHFKSSVESNKLTV